MAHGHMVAMVSSDLAQLVRLLRLNCEGEYALFCGTSSADSFQNDLSYGSSETNTTSTFDNNSSSTIPDAAADVTVIDDDDENLNRILRSFLRALVWVGALCFLICCSQSFMRLSEWWMRRHNPNYGQETSAENEEQQLDTGIISRKARLFGLTLEERKRILDNIFESTSFVYREKDKHNDKPNLNEALERASESLDVQDLETPKDTALEVHTQQSEPNRARSATAETTTEERDLELGETEEEAQTGRANEPSCTTEDICTGRDIKINKGESDDESIAEGADGDRSCCFLASDSSTTDGTDKMCSICLAEYEDQDQVILGAKCRHLFHRECASEWSAKHDLCPYCRAAMITAQQMRLAAKKVLGKKRVQEMNAIAKAKLAAAAAAAAQRAARNNAAAATTDGEHSTNRGSASESNENSSQNNTPRNSAV